MPSVLGNAILGVLEDYGPSTSEQIAMRLSTSQRGVATSLMHLRGQGLVTDGSVIYDHADGGVCMHHTPTPYTWSLGEGQRIQGECPEKGKS